ncbi:MAG: hypothetical protein PHV82_07050 [Victivallaceae bacterium]|nr:hypothetical protein [Victivallaceae bacterium]
MDKISLMLRDGRTSYRPGGKIRGEVEWDLSRDVRDITINIFWYTGGVGDQDSEAAVSEKIDMPMQNGRRSFEMELPMAPYSYSGRITSLKWAVEASVSDEVKDVKEFSITPDNREIVLPEVKEQIPNIKKFLQSFGKKR